MTNMNMRKSSMLLTIREMQVTTTVKYHLIPIGMAIIKITAAAKQPKYNKCW